MLIKEKVKEKLRLLGTPGSWNHITRQSGTHGYLGLNCKFQDRDYPFPTSDLCFNTELHGLVEQSPALCQVSLTSLEKGGCFRVLYRTPTDADTSYPMYLFPLGLRGILSSVTVTDQQVEFLVKKKHIYLPKTSRINFTCINSSNIDYITQSIHEAVVLTEG